MKISTENPSITIEKNWEEKYKNPFTVKEPYTAVEKKIHKRKKRKDDSRSSDHLSNNGTGRFSDQSWPVKSDCDARRFLLLHYAQRVVDDLAKSSLIRTRPNATTVLTGLFSNLFVLICVCVCVCVCVVTDERMARPSVFHQTPVVRNESVWQLPGVPGRRRKRGAARQWVAADHSSVNETGHYLFVCQPGKKPCVTNHGRRHGLVSRLSRQLCHWCRPFQTNKRFLSWPFEKLKHKNALAHCSAIRTGEKILTNVQHASSNQHKQNKGPKSRPTGVDKEDSGISESVARLSHDRPASDQQKNANEVKTIATSRFPFFLWRLIFPSSTTRKSARRSSSKVAQIRGGVRSLSFSIAMVG